MLSKDFDIQKFLRSLKEFESVEESDKVNSESSLKEESSLLDGSKRINFSLSKNFSEILSEITNYSSIMNTSISDRTIDTEFLIDGDEKFTPSTWGGRGDKVNADIQRCLDNIAELVNSELSTLSNFEFSTKISSIIYSQLFGKEFNVPEYTYTDDNGISLFGKFNKLFNFEIESYRWQFSENNFNWQNILNQDGSSYSSDTLVITSDYLNLNIRLLLKYSNTTEEKIIIFDKKENFIGKTLKVTKKISGLSFISIFNNLKNYKKNIYTEYSNGINFIPPDLFSIISPYEESFAKDTEYLCQYSEVLYEQTKDIQIRLDGIIADCDDFGRYRRYEGLGNIKGQILNLKKVFKPEYILKLIEKIESDVLKITSYSNSGSQDIFEKVSNSLSKLSSNLESLVSSLKRIGIVDGEKITDRSYIYGSSTRDEIIYQLKKLGFNQQQINTVLSSKDLECSFVFLYDELDEKDIYSYFKGGRLAEYLFYLGGESAIKEILDFLISKKDIKYFISLLDKLRKNRDYSISKNRYIYGNILGSFISIFPEAINYLVGPDYKKYQIEIVTSLIQSGTISLTSQELLEKVSSNIPNGIDDINFNQAQDYPLIISEFINLLFPALEDLQDKYKNSNFLSNINGLPGKELNLLLGKTAGKRSYELSGFLAGIEGGRYQSLVSGLIHASLLPKTSPALLPANRRSFSLGSGAPSSSLEELIFKISSFSSGIKELSEILLHFSSDEKILQDEPQIIKSTIFSINKDISYSIRNIKENNNSSFISELRKALDADKPGLSNSPEIDSSQKRGVLTPSQSREIQSLLGNTVSKSRIESNINYDSRIISQKDLLSRWIKLDFSSIDNLEGIVSISPSILRSEGISKEFEEIKNKLTELISNGFINQPKSDYFNTVSETSSNKVQVDNVSICSKLGKDAKLCESEYASKQKVSSNFGNTLKKGSIPIDRPLGVVSEEYASYSNAPGPKLIEELSNGKISASDIDISSNTTYLSKIDVLPSISFKKDISNKEIYSEEEKKLLAGLFDLSNNHLYIEKYSKNSKQNIDDCRLISDPIERQLCINFIKCVRFKADKNKKYLNYCPSSTPGGRLKSL